jgi:putative ABC transport system permease protein
LYSFIVEMAQDAVASIWEQRRRVWLALVGLIVGVCAVISIELVGDALALSVNGMIVGLSDSELFVHPSDSDRDHKRALFSLAEIHDLQNVSDNIEIAYSSMRISDVAVAGHSRVGVQMAGAGDHVVTQESLEEGVPFSDEDYNGQTHSAILTHDVATHLFPESTNALGRSVRIGSHEFRVTGILRQPPAGLARIDFSPGVQIPWTTMEATYLRNVRTAAVVIVKDPARIESVRVDIKRYLSEQRPSSRYQLEDRGDISSGIGSITSALTMVVGLFASISIVVAGIGMMNVMLVLVNDRTPEIGLRRAVGARRSTIAYQFLLETSILSLAGCTVGTILGLSFSWLAISQALVKISGVVGAVAWPHAVLTASIIALIVTVAFGSFPAITAARMLPIEALRHE